MNYLTAMMMNKIYIAESNLADQDSLFELRSALTDLGYDIHTYSKSNPNAIKNTPFDEIFVVLSENQKKRLTVGAGVNQVIEDGLIKKTPIFLISDWEERRDGILLWRHRILSSEVKSDTRDWNTYATIKISPDSSDTRLTQSTKSKKTNVELKLEVRKKVIIKNSKLLL